MQSAISVRNLSKCYRLGVISRQSLVDEVRYWWLKARGHDPNSYFSKVGYTDTEARAAKAERENQSHFWALKDVSFDVQPGEVVGIIGRNGAGKSTLLKILTRITEPTSGEAIINGRVASLLEVGTGFHPELTGRENIYMNGSILGMKKREIDARFDEIVAFSELEKFVDTPVKRYSSGMYVRLAFAIAAHLEPEILLVDEVLAVGDMAFQTKCLSKMKDVASGGRTALFVSHNMGAVMRLCNKTVLLSSGRLVMYNGTREVLECYADTTLDPPPDIQSQIQAMPSDRVFQWLDITVTQEGEPPGRLVNGKPFSLIFTYRVRRELYGFHVYFRLCDFYDTVLTESLSDGQTGTIQKCAPGVYRSCAKIPANLLNEGEYKLDIRVSVHNIRENLARPIVLPLRIIRDGLVNRTYPDYKSPAKLLPYIEWSTICSGRSD